MPPKKSKSKSKSRSRKPAKHTRFPRLLAAALVVVLVVGIVAVKYFQSPGGRARLLDAGFDGYYAQIQADIGDGLRDALGEFDLRGKIDEKAINARIHGKTVRLLQWRIACDPSHTYVLINVALSKAVRNDGGTVRRSEETDDGNTLLFTVGTRKYDTHRLTFTRAAPSVVASPPLPKLALVIDDLGYSRNGVVKDILSMDLPLTISVLPSLPYSTFALERAQKEGKCTILHLPMEPDEEQGSDLPMVTTEMETRDIQRLVERYIQSMPGIEGVNNHQGSRATADRRVVDAVMEVIKAYDLYFLDSLTSSKSIAYNAAKDMGIASARNDGFLDADTEDPEVVERRIRQLVATAKERGTAIGIGHPRPWTLEALENTKVFLKNADVELVFLSDIVN